VSKVVDDEMSRRGVIWNMKVAALVDHLAMFEHAEEEGNLLQNNFCHNNLKVLYITMICKVVIDFLTY